MRVRVYRNLHKKCWSVQRKNIHAYVVGMMVPSTAQELWARVKYNPYKFETFVDMSGNAVHTADSVFLNPDGEVYALNPGV